MNDIKIEYTMTYLLKEWIYQKRWIFCFLLTAICFPLGLAVSVLTAKYDYNYRYEQSNKGFHAGIAALVVAAVEGIAAGVASLAFQNTTATVVLSIFAAITAGWGIFSISYCKKINDRIAYFDYFDNIIEVHHITSVAEIAKIIGKSNNFTLKLLKDMIARERLEKASVSGNQEELIVYRKWYKQTFLCKTCGAEYSINIGNEVVCPYCGNPSSENYLGDISDNVKAEKPVSPLISMIRRNTMLNFWGGGIIRILSYVLFVLEQANQNPLILAIPILFLITGAVMTILSFIYGEEDSFEKVFSFFRRHRIINSILQWIFGFTSFYQFVFGLLAVIMPITDDSPLVGIYESVLIMIYGFILLFSGILALSLIIKIYTDEHEYW